MFTYQKLYRAYLDCRKNKRKTLNALKFEINLEENLAVLLKELQEKTYCPGRSICFVVTRPVPREIFASDFRDRIVHHLLVREMINGAEKKFSASSFACRVRKGTHRAVSYLRKNIRQASKNNRAKIYYAQLDIGSFFMSIDQNILYALVEKLMRKSLKIKNYRADFFWLARLVIFHQCTKNYITKGRWELFDLIPACKSLRRQPQGKGLPIGNHTSQFFANLYLNELDQFMKRKLHCRHYVRYVDDFIILEKDLKKLEQLCHEVDNFLQENLKLKLNQKKTKIQPLDCGIDFLGYFAKPEYLLVRKKVVRRFKAKLWQFKQLKNKIKLEKAIKTIDSYRGHFSFAKSFRLKMCLHSI